MKILWWRSQTTESEVRLQRPLLANTLQQPELGGAAPPRNGAVEERKRLSSITPSGPLPRFPVRRFLSVSLAGTPFPRFPARRSLSTWRTLFPRFPVYCSPVRMSCPCAIPSLRRRALSPSAVLPVRRSLRRSLAPTMCVSSIRCLARPPLAAPLPRSGAVGSLAPVSRPSIARLRPWAALLPRPLDRTRYCPTTRIGRSCPAAKWSSRRPKAILCVRRGVEDCVRRGGEDLRFLPFVILCFCIRWWGSCPQQLVVLAWNC